MSSTVSRSKEKWILQPITKEKGKNVFSSDEVIDAYLKGRKDEADSHTKLLWEKLESNLSRARKLSSELFNEINQSGFEASKLHLKIKDIFNFAAIYIIDEDDYCDDNFSDIYKKSIQLKKEVNRDNTFDLTIIFTPESEHLMDSHMLADGYVYSYGK